MSFSGQQAARKLERHVLQFLAGAPYRPFHHTLGISGRELSFTHPDEMFYSLAIALPWLSEPARKKAKEFLAITARQSSPWAIGGFDLRAGRPRESYDVPRDLAAAGHAQARHAFGVYALWAWCEWSGERARAAADWDQVKSRIVPLLQGPYRFDVGGKRTSQSDSEKLNGDLAGLVGFFRLARLNADPVSERQARSRAAELLEFRVNLERTNPWLLEPSLAATKSLHNARLARYCTLAPEVGQAVRQWGEGRGASALEPFRQERNGWYLAFGDRMIGGENYTNPLHFSRAVFAGAILIERLPVGQLLNFLDVPWCSGDFYFIEKCVYVLWADAGCPWQKAAP